jgi:hypothetical protein
MADRATPAGCRGCVCPGLRTRMPAPGRSGLRGHTTAAGVPSVPKLLPGCSPGHSFGYFSPEGTSVRQTEGRCRQARSDRPGVRRRRVQPMVEILPWPRSRPTRSTSARRSLAPVLLEPLFRHSWPASRGRMVLNSGILTALRIGVIREWDAPAGIHHRAAGGDQVGPPGLATGLWLVKAQVSRYSLRTKGGEQHGESRRCVHRRDPGAVRHEPVSGPGPVGRAVSFRQAGSPVRPPMGE